MNKREKLVTVSINVSFCPNPKYILFLSVEKWHILSQFFQNNCSFISLRSINRFIELTAEASLVSPKIVFWWKVVGELIFGSNISIFLHQDDIISDGSQLQHQEKTSKLLQLHICQFFRPRVNLLFWFSPGSISNSEQCCDSTSCRTLFARSDLGVVGSEPGEVLLIAGDQREQHDVSRGHEGQRDVRVSTLSGETISTFTGPALHFLIKESTTGTWTLW